MKRFGFPKSERLCFRTMIDALFAKGETVYAYPLRLTYRVVEKADLPEELHGAPLQLMVNVPKKRFKHAVDRVRGRRLMREAWRLQRSELRDKFAEAFPERMLHVGIVFVSSKMPPFASIQAKMEKLLTALEEKIFPAEAANVPAPEDNTNEPQA